MRIHKNANANRVEWLEELADRNVEPKLIRSENGIVTCPKEGTEIPDAECELCVNSGGYAKVAADGCRAVLCSFAKAEELAAEPEADTREDRGWEKITKARKLSDGLDPSGHIPDEERKEADRSWETLEKAQKLDDRPEGWEDGPMPQSVRVRSARSAYDGPGRGAAPRTPVGTSSIFDPDGVARSADRLDDHGEELKAIAAEREQRKLDRMTEWEKAKLAELQAAGLTEEQEERLIGRKFGHIGEDDQPNTNGGYKVAPGQVSMFSPKAIETSEAAEKRAEAVEKTEAEDKAAADAERAERRTWEAAIPARPKRDEVAERLAKILGVE